MSKSIQVLKVEISDLSAHTHTHTHTQGAVNTPPVHATRVNFAFSRDHQIIKLYITDILVGWNWLPVTDTNQVSIILW